MAILPRNRIAADTILRRMQQRTCPCGFGELVAIVAATVGADYVDQTVTRRFVLTLAVSGSGDLIQGGGLGAVQGRQQFLGHQSHAR